MGWFLLDWIYWSLWDGMVDIVFRKTSYKVELFILFDVRYRGRLSLNLPHSFPYDDGSTLPLLPKDSL